jgi:hypothetical protein
VFEKIIKDIYMGDRTITIKKDRKDQITAQITGLGIHLEMRVKDNQLQIRLPVHSLGWVNLSFEELVKIFDELGCTSEIAKLLEQKR